MALSCSVFWKRLRWFKAETPGSRFDARSLLLMERSRALVYQDSLAERRERI
jgi:hypothetical protein